MTQYKYKVRVADYHFVIIRTKFVRLRVKTIIKISVSIKYTIMGVICTQSCIYDVVLYASLMRSCGAHIIFGGVHITSLKL